MLEALDALPEPRLIVGDLIREPGLVLTGGVCAIGSVGIKRGLDMTEIEAHDPKDVAAAFGIAHAMAAEIEWMNDEVGAMAETPEERFIRVRIWIIEEIKEDFDV